MTSSVIESLLKPTVQKFIIEHENDDVSVLLLKHKKIEGVAASLIVDQIVGRRKAKSKLPVLYNTPGIIYPPALNMEQCSSETTADFKSTLIQGACCADLTGGFGIDSLFFSKKTDTVHFIEKDASLLKIAQHNHHTLKAGNIIHHHDTAEQFVTDTKAQFDFIYLDPSRRIKGDKKVFKLSECEPNPIKLLPLIFKKSKKILIKSSPMLDIQQGIRELGSVEKLFVVSVENECKEILLVCDRNSAVEPLVCAVNLSGKGHEFFSFLFSMEKKTTGNFSKPGKFIYEPNASILKAGAFKQIGTAFNLMKIQASTHLYTADVLVHDFPGRIFKIEAEVKADQKSWNSFLPHGKANIITRNHPLSPEELKKKTGLNDGGEKYLLAFTGLDQKHLLVAQRIK